MNYFKIILFFALTSIAHSQEVNRFIGVIKVQDTLIISYKLNFIEMDGKVSGFSLTDFGGEHETKSKISGTYDNENKVLAFNEIALIYTKSIINQQDFCNIFFQPSKFKMGSNKLMGKFKGKFNDGTECINGEILMNSVEKVDKRVAKFKKKVEKSRRVPDSLKQKLRATKIMDTLNLNVLKVNEVTSILTTSKSLKFYIYDGGQIDDDIISILKNGKVILSRHRISEKKELIEILLDSNKIELTIISDSVGTIGSNTAIIEIIDNNNTIKTMTNLKKGENTKINIIKRQ